ncbi:MAG: ergothioneine biosynthesis protein EgtB, partial [Terriglobales bacterium]
MTASLAHQLPSPVSASLGDRFAEIRDTTMRITAALSPEDQMLQSMPDASPAKWHLAHTTWFFETFVLLAHSPGYQVFDPHFQYLFNSYYKQQGSHPSRGSRGLMSRPSLERVHAYRSHVDAATLALRG